MLPALKQGSVLRGRYRIVDAIGQGGMGSIYRAEDARLDGRICAIKVIQLDPQGSPDQHSQAREQFYREASILARLDHPNLPKVSDFFNEGNQDFLVMDYIPGEDLRTKIEEASRAGRFLEERLVLNWATQLCDALQYLHNQQSSVLHRDIKPANIKLTPEGLIKLVDFGLVKIMVPDDSRTVTVLQGRGSAYYTPLEQYGGDSGHTDARSDIYALGATLYHLLTNAPPAEAKARFLQPNSVVPPREINPAVRFRTEQAVMWALEMHPDDRPESIAEFKDALRSTGPLATWPRGQRTQKSANIAPINQTLVIMAVGLLIVAFFATLFAPPLPLP